MYNLRENSLQHYYIVLQVAVEGLVYEKIFEADAGLKYKFAWDRRNAYNQKVYGIVTAQGMWDFDTLK